ncbi:MAG TPA: alpha/beta fold hydrolase, partial [Roseiflexaceae bacterium]|nr:alpha/beta fold hydrolase [Roseiflexaceae bacterium]
TAGTASVSWGARRMGITDVKFQQQQVPSKSWVDVPPEGTVDGNKVRIIARFENPTHNTVPGPVRFVDDETGELLPKGELPLSLAPNTSAELTYEWDTQGWAWNDGRGAGAHPDRRIRIELGPPDEAYDTIIQPIVVRAKPVVMVHGLNSNAATWASYPAFLQAANRTWKGYAVDTMRTGNDVADQQASNTIVSNAFELAKFIEQVRAREQAWHVDVVAHSMGGLITRQYIHSFMQTAPSVDDQPLVRHLAMLGTPNQGSVCALGLAAINEFLDIPNLNAPIELTPDVVANFNRQVTNERNVKFSVIAGNNFPFPCVPLAMAIFTPSDLVVTVKSAHHTYSDIGLTPKHHVAMTGDKGIFDLWVVPHLAIGRGGEPSQRAAELAGMTTDTTPEPTANLQFSQIASQDVPAGGSLDIPLQIPASSSLGVMLVAPQHVSAALIMPDGSTADTSAAGDERALQPYRVLNADVPPAGQWKLRLQNTAQQPATVKFGVMLSDAALVAIAQFGAPGDDGRL